MGAAVTYSDAVIIRVSGLYGTYDEEWQCTPERCPKCKTYNVWHRRPDPLSDCDDYLCTWCEHDYDLREPDRAQIRSPGTQAQRLRALREHSR